MFDYAASPEVKVLEFKKIKYFGYLKKKIIILKIYLNYYYYLNFLIIIIITIIIMVKYSKYQFFNHFTLQNYNFEFEREKFLFIISKVIVIEL